MKKKQGKKDGKKGLIEKNLHIAKIVIQYETDSMCSERKVNI